MNWVIGVSDADTIDGNEKLEELITVWVAFNKFDNEFVIEGGFEKKDCIFDCFFSAMITIYFNPKPKHTQHKISKNT